MSSNKNHSKIAGLLNKHFHHMSFTDKKKVLTLVVTEQQCDEMLVRFLARYYNINVKEENEKLQELNNYPKEDIDNSEENSSNSSSEQNLEEQVVNNLENIDETKSTAISTPSVDLVSDVVLTPTVENSSPVLESKTEKDLKEDYNKYTAKKLRELIKERGGYCTSKTVKPKLIEIIQELDSKLSELKVEEENSEEVEVSEVESIEEDVQNLESDDASLDSLSSIESE